MKLVKYPRTRHLEGSRLQIGDLNDHKPLSELRGETLVLEEKLDGSNCAISFDRDGGLLLQSRGHYLTGGGRERHFALFKTWAAAHAQRLNAVLGDRYVMFGEWLYAKHTVFYDQLAHFFFEFDVLDRREETFLDTPARAALLHGLPVMPVPVLHAGPVASLRQLEALVRPSLYKTPDWRAALSEAAAASGNRPDHVARQTEDSDLAEGLYIKLEQDGVVRERFKFVRAGFHQTIQAAEGHWLDRPILPNRLATGIDIFAPVLGVQGAYDA
ncbi:MAG: RNA ligase family protein [Pseudomonadota bacterium]